MISNSQVEELEDRFQAATYQKIPVTAARAEGSRIWDLEGKEYIDFMSGYGVAILGHSNPVIREAISRQMELVSITHASVYSPARAQFLSDLNSILPAALSRMILSNSGAEAIEGAVKIAVKSTGRRKLVSMERAYHGKTLAALSITHSGKYRKSFGDILVPNVEFARYGSLESLEQILKQDDVAAVFLEPVQGEGGINLPPPGYLEAVRELTEDHGALLVLDEIQSGLGRTGKMWAHEHWNVTPDVMTIGKGIGGGIPMGIVAGKPEFVDSLEKGEQSSTTGGNPLACAAGSAVISQLKAGYVEVARDMGTHLLSRLQEEFNEHRLVSSVRGLGMMLAVELRIRFLPVLMKMLDMGLITLYSGINTIRVLPPYTTSRDDIEEAIGIMAAAFEARLKTAGVTP